MPLLVHPALPRAGALGVQRAQLFVHQRAARHLPRLAATAAEQLHPLLLSLQLLLGAPAGLVVVALVGGDGLPVVVRDGGDRADALGSPDVLDTACFVAWLRLSVLNFAEGLLQRVGLLVMCPLVRYDAHNALESALLPASRSCVLVDVISWQKEASQVQEVLQSLHYRFDFSLHCLLATAPPHGRLGGHGRARRLPSRPSTEERP